MAFHGNNGYANAPQYYVYTYIACLIMCERQQWRVFNSSEQLHILNVIQQLNT
jgi:hypothetical protein